MKNIILITILLLLSCTNNGEEPKTSFPDELIGKWKIVEQYVTDGTCIENCWVKFNSGNEYDVWFKSDGTYTNYENTNCNDCTFYTSGDKLFFLPNGQDNPGTIKLLNDQHLTLWWNDYEGFGYKYIKLFE